MRDYDDPEYNKLAEKSISLENDWYNEKTHELIEDKVMKEGIYAYLSTNNGIISGNSLAEKYRTHWFKSFESVLSENPFGSWLLRKKWPLKERLILHILHFQQVCRITILCLVLTGHS